ncbi:hypothetical protein HRI_000120000 [Hibiscus trionum]|uniref:Uncharacterized protein n=1 Tax=Hibiscus trionum TaxID=183268 RepID=A0A9W7GRU4_HIBTR|nr:hypothetical protein HRI_000120000 [Hibiscus trionum]
MDISWRNSNRRRNQSYLHAHSPPPPFYFSQEPTSLTPPPQPSTSHPYPTIPPPPTIPSNYYSSPPFIPGCYSNPVMGRYPSQYPPYFANQTSASPAIRAHVMVVAQPQSPPP